MLLDSTFDIIGDELTNEINICECDPMLMPIQMPIQIPMQTSNKFSSSDNSEQYDSTTTETYRMKRIYKLNALTDADLELSNSFEFNYKWNPYTGIRTGIDEIGPLCFNAIELYDYYYSNRYRGLWNPPTQQFQGFYGDHVGTGKNIHVLSRGTYPEKYVFRLPIIDCYLPPTHKYSIVTMGPELTDEEIKQIDLIVMNYHPKRNHQKFASLAKLKKYYDNSLNSSPDPKLKHILDLKKKFPDFTEREINDKYNRYWVDKLVGIKY